jgi:hypothetical protein
MIYGTGRANLVVAEAYRDLGAALLPLAGVSIIM